MKKKSPKPKQKPSLALKQKNTKAPKQKTTPSKKQTNANVIPSNNQQINQESLKAFLITILNSIPISSLKSITASSLTQTLLKSLPKNNKIKHLVQADKQWFENELQEAIKKQMNTYNLQVKCCTMDSDIDSWKDLSLLTSEKNKNEPILQSIITSLRSDYMQEHFSINCDQGNNVFQHIQSFLQYLSQEEANKDSIIEMMNMCSLYILKPNDKEASSILYFIIESYTQLLTHYMKLNIAKEDKLSTFSNILSLLNNDHKLKFCAHFIKLRNYDDDLTGDVCKLISMNVSSSPRIYCTTSDQYEKFIAWSDDILDLKIDVEDDGEHDDDRVDNEDAVNNYLLDGDEMNDSSNSDEEDESGDED